MCIPFLLLIALANCAHLFSTCLARKNGVLYSEGRAYKRAPELVASPQSTALHFTGNTSVKNSVLEQSRPQQHTWNSKPLLYFPAELLLHKVYIFIILCGLRLWVQDIYSKRKPSVPQVRRRRPRRGRITPPHLLSWPCVSTMLQSKRPRAGNTLQPATLYDSKTPNPVLRVIRVWPYATFIVFASSSSGKTSDQNLEVLNIIMLILKHTVKAPNFDRVFMKNIFLLHIFVVWLPLNKIDRACKIKVFVVPKLKFLFWGS